MSNTSSPGHLKSLCKNCTVSWIDIYLTPRKTVSNVEGYVVVAAALLLILSVLGPLRRRSRSWLVQYGVRGAYILSFPLLSYILGLMQGIAKNELYPVWSTFIVLLFGGANSVSVQKLDENKQWLKLMLDNVLYLYYVGTISGSFAFVPGTAMYIRFGALVILFVLISTKNMGRLTALMLASDPRSSGSRTVDRHMKQYYDEMPAQDTDDPHTMQGYNYLVLPFQVHKTDSSGQVNNNQSLQDESITLEKIWSHDNGILSNNDHAMRQLKDACLSFALFRLVVRRYFGYSCPESGHTKTRDLVLRGLLQKSKEDHETTTLEVQRAFQVIEVELAFLYDFFFTKHAMTMCRGEIRSVALSFGITFLTMGIGTYALIHPNNSENFWDFGLVETTKQDIIVTKVILSALALFQMVQIWLYCSSDWAKVSLVTKYVRKLPGKRNIFIEKVLSFMGKLWLLLERHEWFQRWENKIGQYSVMDSFSYPGHELEKYGQFIPMLREGRKRGTSIAVPMVVKEAIARTLKDSKGQISLRRHHGMTAELYDLERQNNNDAIIAHVILIWHIATAYCESSDLNGTNTQRNVQESPDSKENVKSCRNVAISLSKYCAYLVAFAPGLVPGKPLETESTLDDLLEAARKYLSTSKLSASNKYEMFGKLLDEGTKSKLLDEGTKGGIMLAKGIILGKELEGMENQWKLLADFWTELMLYIAPSNNLAGHIESLAQGDEFVTHVWALLMHAGILERPATAAN